MPVRLVSSAGTVTGHPLDQSALFLRGADDWFCQYLGARATRYEGWFLADQTEVPHRYFKFLERIDLPDTGATAREITHSPNTTRFDFFGGNSVTQIIAQNQGDSGAMLLRGEAVFRVGLNLDMRGIYLQPDQDRVYAFQADTTGLLISYTDPTLAGRTLYLHLRGKDKDNLPLLHWPTSGTWKEAAYPRDAARHSEPSRSYIFGLEILQVRELAMGIGFSTAQAIAASDAAASLVQPDFDNLPVCNELEAAVALTETSLAALRTSQGYYAGFPWFHQFWSRDELITALGLPRDEQLAMLERYLKLPLTNGELPTFAGSGTTCADGIGWLALLVREYGLDTLAPETREQLRRTLAEAVSGLQAHRLTPSGLIWSNHNATWMDTIGRTGCRLEIQCMYALALELLNTLSGEPHYADQHAATLETIRHTLFHNDYLADGLDSEFQLDPTKRPNVFLAYLLQPNLLGTEQWQSCFDQVLTATLTNWDGLSSIDQSSPQFHALSTGETNESYHNGDSWFFVNNLAALALKRFNAQHYASTIEALTESSVRETLWQNFLGCPGEIASSETGDSWGCGLQGFSGGAFVKLARENHS